MKFLGLFALISVFFCSSVFAEIDLKSAFQLSLKQSETIGAQDQKIIQAEELVRQAYGGLLPSITATGSYAIQDPGSSFTSLAPTVQPLVRLTANQPLFRGFREYAFLNRTKHLKEAQEFTKESAELTLLQEVTQSFFSVLSLEKDLQNFQKQVDLYEKRVKEIQDRIRIGRSRQSEVLNVKSEMATVRSQLGQVKGLYQSQLEMFKFLTGMEKNKIVLSDSFKTPESLQELKTLDTFLAKIESRPDIKSGVKALDAAESNVWVNKGEHLPSLDLSGNYYVVRKGFNENVKWDAALTVTLPLYLGGMVSSRTRSAVADEQQAYLSLSYARRRAVQEITSLYETIKADLEQLVELTQAKDFAEKLYETQTKDYRYGLVTNTDVLISLLNSQTVTRTLDRMQYQTKADYIKLELAAGNRF